MLSALGLSLFGLLLGIRHAVDPDHVLIVLGLANLLSRAEVTPPRNSARPVVVGMVHGLAGSAAAVLLVLAAVRETAWAIGYLMLFGLGTIVGMIAVTTAIAVPAAYAANRVTALRRYLVLASGAASVIAGTLIAVQLAGNGLFSASPVWVPR